MREDYRKHYRELYEQHWWWRAREKMILDILRRRQPPCGWRLILDVGCGDGLFFDRLSQFGEVEGVEPASDMVTANGPHRHRIHLAPFDERFQPGKRFSLILMLDVLEHLSDPVPALRHAVKLLAPDGTLLVTVPAFELLWTTHDIINNHFRRYTKKSFRELACQSGLPIKAERYFFHWLFPIKVATRVAERVFELEPKRPTIPGHWINGLLYKLSCFEQRTWGTLPLPFGSSLLVLGCKPYAS